MPAVFDLATYFVALKIQILLVNLLNKANFYVAEAHISQLDIELLGNALLQTPIEPAIFKHLKQKRVQLERLDRNKKVKADNDNDLFRDKDPDYVKDEDD
ncbi:hypothetical protein MMC22_002623 [Lobaria immixta]|nr:hypothetical protein [Lobaria immixta]